MLSNDTYYTYVPLSSFAVESGSKCELYIQYVEDIDETTLILGAMFMQNFKASFFNFYDDLNFSIS